MSHAALIILVAGALIGLMQGLVIGKIGVPAFVTTLACEFIFRGLLTLVTEASGTIPVTDEVFNSLSNGFLPELFMLGQLHGLTVIVGLLAIVAIIVSQIQKRKELKKYNFEIVSMPIFIFKIVFFIALIGRFDNICRKFAHSLHGGQRSFLHFQILDSLPDIPFSI